MLCHAVFSCYVIMTSLIITDSFASDVIARVFPSTELALEASADAGR